MKHITINALQLKNQSSGIGVMIEQLFSPFCGLTQRPVTIVYSKDSPIFSKVKTEDSVVFSPYNYGQSLGRMLYQSFQLGRKHCKNAVFLTTDSKMPLLLPKSTIPLPVVTDLAIYRMSDTYQLSRVLWWRLQYALLTQRTRHYIAISEYTKQDMVELLHIPPEQIDVVYCAAPESRQVVTNQSKLINVQQKYGLPDKYILFVGNCNPRKNLIRCMQAFEKVKEQGLPHKLVIVGGKGWKFQQKEALSGISCFSDVIFTGFIPEEDMSALYTKAELFLFPSLYEGFGIPVIESQQCGTPVLTSAVSALPEVGGDGAYYVDPTNVDAIANAMVEILQTPALAQELINKGFANATRFSWEASARQLHTIIERILNDECL